MIKCFNNLLKTTNLSPLSLKVACMAKALHHLNRTANLEATMSCNKSKISWSRSEISRVKAWKVKVLWIV